jgi:toxin CcdB
MSESADASDGMAQFHIHRNLDPMTAGRYPLLTDIQDNLLSGLSTRLVIPLVCQEGHCFDVLWNLVPELTVEEQRYVLLVPQLTHVRAEQLGPAVRSLGDSERHLALSAVEMLFRGL